MLFALFFFAAATSHVFVLMLDGWLFRVFMDKPPAYHQKQRTTTA
jgi:hypothetical protein